MSWPTPNDYCAAVQNPQHCFTAPELSGGSIVRDPLGLPKVSSGNFAVVFELADGSQRHAVKCFTRQVRDQQQRYAAITRFLSGRRAPALVSFRYFPEGIRLAGALFPLLSMEWIAGELLHQVVERRLATPALLRELAEHWRSLVADLTRLGVAHGDLQHRNILVAGGQIRLVDYDGMFVPGLRGNAPDERGNDQFQHPGRTKHDYDERVDRFAALVIYLSLRALIADPSLWGAFHSGENLILSHSDYVAPGATGIWRRLAGSPDQEVQRLAVVLERACAGAPADTPDLETALRLARPPLSMAATDWQKLAQALGVGAARPSVPAAAKPVLRRRRPRSAPKAPPEAVAGPPVCSEGHATPREGYLCYCPQCLAQGKRTALHGWQAAPCGHHIPARSHFCPDCGASTGW
ncbi:MAG TPA: hypothetical protein VGP33_07545 [Chloroflexota bacterium]|jgi:hypothetical protein|nr:hypothetical protein [Chloroflexota bacterium]